MSLAENRIFKRQLRKLPIALQTKARQRLNLLVVDEFNPLLNNHKLGPPYEGYRSINITGDWRLVYKKIGTDTYYLRAVGTHHQLYGT